ncbi:cytochrome P450 [Bisporella sp. PMI_857]|nr:cytochrome P450 [Bisporella sp. PMI_857]
MLQSVFPIFTQHHFFKAVVGCLLILLYMGFQRVYPRPIPGIPYNARAARSFIGDLVELGEIPKNGESVRLWFLRQAKRHKSAIVQIFLGPFAKPAVLISDYQEVHDILMYRGADFKRGKKVDVFSGILPHAFPAMESFDPRFKSCRSLMRDLMTPSFLYKVSAPQAYNVSSRLVELWRIKSLKTQGRPFDVSNDIVLFSFDAILSAAMGLSDSGGDLDHQIALHGATKSLDTEDSMSDNAVTLEAAERSAELKALTIDEESLGRAFYFPSPRLYHLVNKLRPSVRNAGKTLRKYINSQIDKAVQNLGKGCEPQCALDYVIQRELEAAEKAGRKPVLDDPRIRDGIYGYLIAGHDTSTGSLTWLLRRLVAHPTEQVKIRENLHETYRSAWGERRSPTAVELIKAAPYLEAFIEEGLRFNCPVVTIMIYTRADTLILGHEVPNNTAVFLNLSGPSLNMPSVPVADNIRSSTSQSRRSIRTNWDDMEPEVFRPERWLKKDNSGKVVFDAFSGPTLSFSAGDRGCWGKRLGNLELRIVLTLLVWNFHFNEVPEELNTWETYDSLVTAPKHCFLRLSQI